MSGARPATPRRMLVTGAAGQAGFEVARLAAAAGWAVAAPPRAALDVTSANDVRAALGALRPAVVVNCAAYTAVDRAEAEPELARAVNGAAPGTLGRACRNVGAAMIHLSTDYVFDGAKAAPYREDDPVGPINAYGQSKAEGERALAAALEESYVVRTSWLSGGRGRSFVAAMLSLGAERDAVPVVDDQWGCPTFAADIARVILTLAERIAAGDAPPPGIYHYCGAGETTRCRFAQAIFSEAAPWLGREPRAVAVTSAEYPSAARRPARSALDCGRIERALGTARLPWRDGLRRLLCERFAA